MRLFSVGRNNESPYKETRIGWVVWDNKISLREFRCIECCTRKRVKPEEKTFEIEIRVPLLIYSDPRASG